MDTNFSSYFKLKSVFVTIARGDIPIAFFEFRNSVLSAGR